MYKPILRGRARLRLKYKEMGLKRRTRKGRVKSDDMCPGCYYQGCNSMHGFFKTSYIKKRNYRLAHNLCVSCGHNPCSCKRREYKSNVK